MGARSPHGTQEGPQALTVSSSADSQQSPNLGIVTAPTSWAPRQNISTERSKSSMLKSCAAPETTINNYKPKL